MKYKLLGNTGLFVSEICFGTMTFSGKGWFNGVMGTVGQKDATALIGEAVQAGVNFIDTADVYSEGESEAMTGQAIRDLGIKRSDVVLATKVFGRMGPGPNDAGASRGHIMDAVSHSLERLQTDHIDLYQIHQGDMITPVEETMRALDDLVRQGMVRYLGVSNWESWRVMKANGIADKRGLARLEMMQAYYSLAGRDTERDVVPMLEDQKMGLMVWGPLAGGYMSGKFSEGGEAGAEGRRKTFDFPPVNRDKCEPIIAAMRPIAKSHGVSVARVALAYVLNKPFVTSMIIGVRNQQQLRDNLEATTLKLTAAETEQLDALSALPNEFPRFMVVRQHANTRMAHLPK